MTMTFFECTKPLELKIPTILVRHAPLGIEIETNLVELRFSFRIYFTSFEECSLSLDPSAQ
jgi:hypothetical protein